MKILQMNLIAFGPFKNALLELGDGDEGLHIIYGPNEAGKSSALRALRQMLFGIPERSLDDFIHPYAKLRIGAVIEQSDGTRLEFIRRKGRANTLRGPDDSTVLDDAVLRPFLGGMTLELFSTMFGIDHGDLVSGGTEIIQGGGCLGQMLFAAVNKEWFNAWEPAGISPRSPREMRAWVLDQQGIIKELREIRIRRAKADDLKGRIETHRNELDRYLSAISQPSAKPEETLSDLIRRSRKVIEKQEKLRTELDKLAADKKEREKALKDARRRRDRIEKEISLWQSEWEQSIRPLGLDGNASPGQANAVMDDLKNLFDKLKEADILHKRIKGIDRDAEAFSQRVTALAEHVAEELKGLPVEQAAADLNGRLTRAREAGTELKGLEKQIRQEEKQLREAEKRISEARLKLDRMCEEAHCSKYEDLSEAEKRSSRRRRIEAELEGLEEQLRKLAGGLTVEEFVEEAQRVDPDELDSRIDRLNEEVTSLEEKKTGLDRTIGEEGNELKKMDGSGKAADLAEDVEMILGGMEANIEQYARLRLASAVLSRAIERYREKNEGPILTKGMKRG